MADLRELEKLVEELERGRMESTPTWILGYKDKTVHISGQLREAAGLVDNSIVGLPSLVELMYEAAERLDDAHLEWMERNLDDINARFDHP